MEKLPENRVWSEEEMAYLEPEPRRAGLPRGRLAGGLRRAVLEHSRGMAAHKPHELTRGEAVVFAPDSDAASHGNFIDASYRRIVADPAWSRRLTKAHTAKRQARPTGADEEIRGWRELDTATSSDALLMNIFCYPRLLAGGRLPALLGVEPGLRPEFGYRPALLVEAKLTESDFQTAPLRLLERYPAFAEVFDRELLSVSRRGVASYQLIRGVLAAQAEAGSFAVFCDARRPDLIEAWHAVPRAVRSYELRSRLRLYTWQEIAGACPARVREFLAGKYGIG
jgi:hypothetical protein